MSSTASATADGSTHVLSDACCDPGSTTSYPAHLSFPPGQEVQLAGVDCYSVNSAAPHVLLFATDVFGWRYANNRQNADQLAAAGFHVVIPDLFDGGAVTEADLADPSRGPGWLRSEWFPRYAQDKTADKLAVVARALQQRSPQPSTLLAIGYCYGTVAVLRLYQQGLVSAGVMAHPTGFDKDNVAQCDKPTLFCCAETDHRFPPDLRQHWQAALAASGVPARFVDYPGTQHGFAVRDDGTAVGVAARQQAMADAVAWLRQHVAPA